MKVLSIKSLLFLAVVSFAVFSCGGGADTAANTEVEKTAFDAMMVIHDEVMPKMGAVNRMGRDLKKLQTSLGEDERELMGEIDQVRRDLETAEQGMMAWMNANAGGKLDKLREEGKTHEEILAYIADEDKNIKQVKTNINSSIEKAEALMMKIEGTAGEEN